MCASALYILGPSRTVYGPRPYRLDARGEFDARLGSRSLNCASGARSAPVFQCDARSLFARSKEKEDEQDGTCKHVRVAARRGSFSQRRCAR